MESRQPTPINGRLNQQYPQTADDIRPSNVMEADCRFALAPDILECRL
jgi:hypothetical protein